MRNLTDRALQELALLRPAHALPLQNDDYLRIRVLGLGGQTVIVTGRMLTEDGTITTLRYELASSSSWTTFTSDIKPLGAGWLLNLTAILDSSTLGLAQKFVQVELVRGSTAQGGVLAVLIQGAVSSLQRLAWPGSLIVNTLAQPGVVKSIAGTDPAAGVEVSETASGGVLWRLRAFEVTLVTDGTAANRETELVIDDGTTEYARIPTGVNHTATQTRRLSFLQDVPHKAGATALTIVAPLPDLWLVGGHRIRTVTTNLAAGDNYGAPQYQAEEWLLGA